MAGEAKFATPGNGEAWVLEKICADFLGVSDDALRRAASRLPWIGVSTAGKYRTYFAADIGYLAEAMRKKLVGDEVFSRSPRDAPERPETPGDAPTKSDRKARNAGD